MSESKPASSLAELRTLLPYLRPYRGRIAWGLLFVVLANAFGLLVPWLIKRGIDAVALEGTTAADVTRTAVLVVLVALIGGAARYGMREMLNGVSRRVEFDLRNHFFAHLLRLDASYYATVRTGELMSRATNDIPAVRMVAGPAYMYLVNTTVVTLAVVSIMLSIDGMLTLVALVPLLALPPVTVGFGRVIHRRFERIQEQFGVLSTMVQENLSGMRIVKAYRQEAPQVRRFDALADDYLEKNLALVRVSGLFHPLLGMIAGFALVGVLLVGGRAVMRGDITIGDFVAFTLYLGYLSWPMIALGWVVNLFQRGAASMARINQVLRTEPSVREPEQPLELPRVRGEIEFRNVSFRYPGAEHWALRDVSFRVPAGSMLAVVGTTGSGKSTLIALLARLYDPDQGEVLLDGVRVDRLPLARLRAAIGLVPQDAFLFSETIRRNLALGFDEPDPAAEQRRIREAARVAQLDETVLAFPNGYDTRLGERGINLSGGQKQRATLARAIARDPEVLVLDDALSAVDTHTEAEILSGLRRVMNDRTSVIVSHRVSAVMGADHIVVLEGGRVVEQGTHAELLRASGVYASLQRRQLLSDDLEGLDAADPLAPARTDV